MRYIIPLLFLMIVLGCNSKKVVEEEVTKEVAEPYVFEGQKLKVGVVGLVHTHVHWILGREDIGDIEIVGIVEPNRDLAKRYSRMHGFSMKIVFDTIEEMVEATSPQAVTAFNTIYDHLSVVEYCAPKGIHVMVEKPLAVSLEHANRMVELAKEHNIHLLTNYETSWYGSTHRAYELVHDQNLIGDLRKMVFTTGHPGPKEIGVNDEFLEWLIDPKWNGAGALTDFGCYGANIATWYMKGQTPLSVSCVTQQIKPDIYPLVDDDATIVLTYQKAQVIIQASWNWSHNRKDMEVYGVNGYILNKDGTHMMVQESEELGVMPMKALNLEKGLDDPFALLNQVVLGGHQLEDYDLSSLENNLIVMQILEIAKESAKTGNTILWEEYFNSN